MFNFVIPDVFTSNGVELASSKTNFYLCKLDKSRISISKYYKII